MVHQFKNNGYDIVLDVNSGAIHVVDDVTYDVIAMFEEHTPDEIVQQLKEQYPEAEIKEAIEKYNAIGNEEGKPSEDYKQSKVNINGLPMTKTTNPLRIGHPDEKGEEMQQTVLLYFQENKRRVFAIVMLVADEKAQADLDAITSSIQIEK